VVLLEHLAWVVLLYLLLVLEHLALLPLLAPPLEHLAWVVLCLLLVLEYLAWLEQQWLQCLQPVHLQVLV
jgi:hypothetical protein